MKKVLLAAICTLLLAGCRTQYVPVETIKTEYATNTVHDSVFVDRVERDSVLVLKDGDTVTIYKTRYVYQDRWRELLTTDTLIRTDSIRVPYPVEGRVKPWEKVKIGAVGMLGGMGVMTIGWLIVWIRRRYKRT